MTLPTPSAAELRKLSKSDLIAATHHLVKEERQITLNLLWHIREIDRRKIPQEMGMSGIFDYCVRVLNYSEGSAFRRIQSMRALAENPDLEKAILDGKINLTTASQLQTFLQKAKRQNIPVLPPIPKDLTEAEASAHERKLKADFFACFKDLSSRKVEEKLSQISPTLARREHERALSDQEIEVRITISTETRKRWTRISELAAHRMHFEPSTRRIVELSAEVTLLALEKEKGMNTTPKHEKGTSSSNPGNEGMIPLDANLSSRRIPVPLRRLIWWRDQGRCTYRAPDTKLRCASRYALEIDHIKPWSLGGSSTDANNLRLLCKSHHQMLTQKSFANIP